MAAIISSDICSIVWPSVFITGELDPGVSKESVLADGIIGWANCTFENPPENFGIGMVEIGCRLGVAPSAENLSALFKKMQDGKLT